MTPLAGAGVGIVGGLVALPLRLAAREVASQGGTVTRGVTRRSTVVVFGRRLLGRADDAGVAARVEAARAAGRVFRSENGFLRWLVGVGAGEGLSRTAVIEQAGLVAGDFELLALFDAFERDVEPFSFRDVILARKYAGLIAGGAGWGAIARSVHRSGPAVSLTAKALQVGGGQAIYACHEQGLSELNGQLLLGLGEAAGADLEEVFVRAEAEEAAGRHDEAAALFARCLAIDPGDAVAAFNRANCLRAAGRPGEAEADLARALSLDPAFAEAWFNLAGLVAARGRTALAREHLARAIALDPGFADAVFNLATLEFEAGDLGQARRWWERYLELDTTSDWARTAVRGVQFVAMQGALGNAG